jgi:hypothetical protein
VGSAVATTCKSSEIIKEATDASARTHLRVAFLRESFIVFFFFLSSLLDKEGSSCLLLENHTLVLQGVDKSVSFARLVAK